MEMENIVATLHHKDWGHHPMVFSFVSKPMEAPMGQGSSKCVQHFGPLDIIYCQIIYHSGKCK